MNKEQVYKQIDDFVNTRIGRDKLDILRWYVNTETAKDKSNFTQWIFKNNTTLKNKQFNNTIDLCYGSGNLTSHILYESDIDTKLLVLNDINIKDRNNEITIGEKTNNDFFDASLFDKKYDLIIFNPQVGGKDTYADGAVEFEKNIEPIIYEGSINDYLNEKSIASDITISIDEKEKIIFIHSEILSQAKMINRFKDIKIFNYYDVFYQSKKSKKMGQETNAVKFRKTLDKISNHNTVVIFLGEENIYNLLFLDYPHINTYLSDEGKQLYILSKDINEKKCYEFKENKFIENKECKKEQQNQDEDLSINKLVKEMNNISIEDKSKKGLFLSSNEDTKEEETPMKEEEKTKIDKNSLGKLNFPHKNILLKGVPGTGKSKTIENIIEKNLDMKKLQDNVLRINIHSASSNSDLMQGISISTNNNNDILYQEKRGAVLKHIVKAMYKPNQPFVLVLEEIQENSLNELIGDLIYLIEKDKRTEIKLEDEQELTYKELFSQVKPKHFVELPNLVANSDSNTKMIMPSNLYVFCTSNYRDDRKVIEDNLLRRFDVVEIYPKYFDESWVDNDGVLIFKSKDISDFLAKLNKSILEQFTNETHPDRYLVGHANWLGIEEDDKALFYTALLKVIIEFKEIREVDFNSYVKPILKKLFKHDELSTRVKSYLEIFYDKDELKLDSYKSLVEKLQAKIYSNFL